jgi:hypothetical protein
VLTARANVRQVQFDGLAGCLARPSADIFSARTTSHSNRRHGTTVLVPCTTHAREEASSSIVFDYVLLNGNRFAGSSKNASLSMNTFFVGAPGAPRARFGAWASKQELRTAGLEAAGWRLIYLDNEFGAHFLDDNSEGGKGLLGIEGKGWSTLCSPAALMPDASFKPGAGFSAFAARAAQPRTRASVGAAVGSAVPTPSTSDTPHSCPLPPWLVAQLAALGGGASAADAVARAAGPNWPCMEQMWGSLVRQGARSPSACPTLSAFLARQFDSLRHDLRADWSCELPDRPAGGRRQRLHHVSL